ncbi:MAG TPA: hypothetical protein VHW01_23600, partial [Polyangiaceae bacterium]|nr:hypothetical protein [Polyangiaceae bacterium]
ANHMAGYDLARPRTEAYDAKLRGLAEGRVAASALQDNIEAKAEAAQRTDASDARDQEAMNRALRQAGVHGSLIKPAQPVDARDVRMSASERAMVASNERARTAWQGPQQAPEMRESEAREQRPAQHSGDNGGKKLSASERARIAGETRAREAWQNR